MDKISAVPLIDGHNDLPWAHRERHAYDFGTGDLAQSQPALHTDLPRLARGHVKGQFWSVYVPSSLTEPDAVVATLEQIDFVNRMVARYPEFAWCRTADDIEDAISAGRLASLIGMEGGHSIGSSLGVLRQMFRLGARYMTLTHNHSTAWADSATDDPVAGGLSSFGRDVVAEMNRLGMMVDLAHVADTTMHAALDVSTAPVIFTHSNARTLCDVTRNVPDDVLERIPTNGGIIMATFVSFFVNEPAGHWFNQRIADAREGRAGTSEPFDPLSGLDEYARKAPPPRVTIDDVVRQIEYLRAVVGLEHVGIGADFDGSQFVTHGLEDVAAYPRLFEALRQRGWRETDIDAVAGRNVLRVMRDVEAVASSA